MASAGLAPRAIVRDVGEAKSGRRACYGLLAALLSLASFVLCWGLSTSFPWTPVALDLGAGADGRDLKPPSPIETPVLLAVRGRGFGGRFRTEACDHERQLPGSKRWDSSPKGFDDREVLDLVDVAQSAEDVQPRLACLVYSTWRNRQRLRDSFAVFGQDCDVFLPFSDEVWADEESGFQTIEVHPSTGGQDNYFTIIAKMRAVFVEVTRRVKAGELAFDFLVVSGDDAFWVIPNLRSYLQTFPTRGAGVYLGHRFAQNGDYRLIYASGAGYVINQIALNAYMNCSIPDKQRGFAEDVVMGVCLSEAGIPVWPSEDANGRERFHFFSPADMAYVDYADPHPSSGQWVHDFHRPWLQALLPGLEGISKASILFHYVTGRRRFDAHDWLYRKIACKGNATEPPSAAPPRQ